MLLMPAAARDFQKMGEQRSARFASDAISSKLHIPDWQTRHLDSEPHRVVLSGLLRFSQQGIGVLGKFLV